MHPPPYLQTDYDITFLSAFKTPARARYFFDIHEHADIEKLHEIYLFSQELGIPLVFLGAGTNCLFAFDVFDGIIIRNRNAGWQEPFEKEGKLLIRIHS